MMVPTAGVLAQASSLNRFETTFVGLVDRALGDPALALVALGVAFAVGALHALAPGHGKAVAAAYLVAGRGRTRDAALLGIVVAVMHTGSVLALGLGLHAVLRSSTGSLPAMTEQITPGIRVVTGTVVAGLGVYLAIRHLRTRRGERHHTHLPVGMSPFSRRGLVLLGASGGILPSPAAFLVLVTAAFTGHLVLGLLLVATFSIGLATTLTVIGVAMIRGREALIERLGAGAQLRLLRVSAGAAAGVLVVWGTAMAVIGLQGI